MTQLFRAHSYMQHHFMSLEQISHDPDPFESEAACFFLLMNITTIHPQRNGCVIRFISSHMLHTCICKRITPYIASNKPVQPLPNTMPRAFPLLPSVLRATVTQVTELQIIHHLLEIQHSPSLPLYIPSISLECETSFKSPPYSTGPSKELSGRIISQVLCF